MPAGAPQASRGQGMSSELLPLFPLGTVLFPGLPLPLHIFEERYRRLVRDLLAGPGPRQFGVIAIRHGHEVGAGGATELYPVGCTAVVREVTGRCAKKGDMQAEPPGGVATEPADHGLGRSRGGLSTKIHLATEQGQKPLAIVVTAGQRGDRPQFQAVLEAICVPRLGLGRPRARPDHVLADKAYGTRANRAYLRRRRIKCTIDRAVRRRVEARTHANRPRVAKQSRRNAGGGGDVLGRSASLHDQRRKHERRSNRRLPGGLRHQCWPNPAGSACGPHAREWIAAS